MASGEFRPDKYWEERLGRDYSLGSVGWASLGHAFNRWMYRVRLRVFRRAVRAAFAGRPTASSQVLDIGSGTGFYIDAWRQLGVSQLTGADITDTAVRQLRERFPSASFVKVDIGDPHVELPGEPFDAISIMDVLYHVVDDARYEAALQNIARLLRPGGTLVLTENMVERRLGGRHQVSRSREAIRDVLERNGLRTIAERPMFWLMNAPVDSHSPLLHAWWQLLVRVVSRNEIVGWLVGALLFPLELTLLRLPARGPSSKIVVCRRR